MSTKPPSDRTRAAFRRPALAEGPPSPEFWILTSEFSPNMQNETPSDRTPAPGGHPVFNPGLSAGAPPVYQVSRRPPVSAKRTQSPPPIYILQSTIYNPMTQFPKPTAKSQKLLFRNEPNFAPRLSCPTTKMRNEPNLPPWPPRLCETNPICPHGYQPHEPKKTKRTQFTPMATPIMRNEPNLHGTPITRNEPNS